jgi:hypothetical protein
MNNDLDVKTAFDSLRLKIAALQGLAQEGKLSIPDANDAVSSLRAVDRVLQVIF